VPGRWLGDTEAERADATQVFKQRNLNSKSVAEEAVEAHEHKKADADEAAKL
jgi:hypothetical protein